MKMSTKEMVTIAVMAALLCVAGPLSIAIGPIPLSLATFAVMIQKLLEVISFGRERSTRDVTSLILLLRFFSELFLRCP